jgi:hypothetical protein
MKLMILPRVKLKCFDFKFLATENQRNSDINPNFLLVKVTGIKICET